MQATYCHLFFTFLFIFILIYILRPDIINLFVTEDKQINWLNLFVGVFLVISVILGLIANILVENHYPLILYNLLSYLLGYEQRISTTSDAIKTIADISKICGRLATRLIILKAVFIVITKRKKLIKLKEDNIIIYGDPSATNQLKKTFKNGVVASKPYGEYVKSDSKNHIICFDDDKANLNFYHKYNDELKDKNVTILLNDFESELFAESDNLHIINKNELVAKAFWLSDRNPLLKKNDNGVYKIINKKIRIAFIGLQGVGKSMLKIALLNNVIDSKQKISYEVFGNESLFNALDISDMNKTSHDSLHYRGTNVTSKESIEILNSCQKIIISNTPDNNSLQEILCKVYKPNISIYLYKNNALGENSMFLKNFYNEQSIDYFGSLSEYTNIKEIFNDDILKLAKGINYYYLGKPSNKTQDKAWEECDFYGKRSSIAAAEYHKIRELLVDENTKVDKKLSELEHIRWCRFMLLDGWKYGKVKDKSNKTHPDLILYNKLSIEEQNKDKNIINYLLKEK